MIIKPRQRGLLCATAHPRGCAQRVRAEIAAVRSRPAIRGPRNALVIGCSAGLGLASRITAAFGSGAATVGVCLERPGTPARPGTAGWYNTAALDGELAAAGLAGRTVVGDAFDDATKERTAELIRAEVGRVDLVVYSLAAPRRLAGGERYTSALKAVGTPFTAKSYDAAADAVATTTLPAASLREVRDTVAVMGGDDWLRWMETLHAHDVLTPDVTTIAYSHVGNERLAPSYRGATIGKAKEHLEWTARVMDAVLRPAGGRAHVAVMRALVTQASTALPIQNLYTIVLQRVMSELGLQETPLDQTYRLFAERLYHPRPLRVDAAGRIRLDDRELCADVQAEVERRLRTVDTENLAELGAPKAYRMEALAQYGFGIAGVDYGRDDDPVWDNPRAVLVPAAAPATAAEPATEPVTRTGAAAATGTNERPDEHADAARAADADAAGVRPAQPTP